MDENSNDIDQRFKEAAQQAARVAYVLDPVKAIERGTKRHRLARRRKWTLSGVVVLVAVAVFVVPLPQLHLVHHPTAALKHSATVPLADSLLVYPGWFGSCCTAPVPESSRFPLTVVDAGTGVRSTIEPFADVNGIKLPWLAIGQHVVALIYPSHASLGSRSKAYAFVPGKPGMRFLGLTDEGPFAATRPDAVWLETGQVCPTVKEVTVEGVALTRSVTLPCSATLEEAVPGGLLLESPLVGSAALAERIEVWNPFTGRVVWSKDEPSAPLVLGSRYMLYVNGPCIPGQCSDIRVTDLATGTTRRVHLAVPLPNIASPISFSNLNLYDPVVTFSPFRPQDVAILEAIGTGHPSRNAVPAELRIIDVLTGRLTYDRKLSVATTQIGCSGFGLPSPPCPSSESSPSFGPVGNPDFPYVSWSWGGDYLLIGQGRDHVVAYPVDSMRATGKVLAARPDSLVVERPSGG